MAKYTKGDRVKIVADNSGEEKHIGEKGMIVDIDLYTEFEYPITLELDSSLIVNACEDELAPEFATKKGLMNSLTILARKVVDADLRNMIKVGWLDNSLQLTTEGEDMVLADYLSENKAKFGKLAEEELKERKRDKDCK